MSAQREELEEVVRTLAGWERPSASEGERRAAEWIAARLASFGLEAQVEEERAHGGYWWPLGGLCAIGAGAGLVGRRRVGVVAGGVAALGLWDELGLRRAWTRRLLPKRPTWNVVAQAGDPLAPRTLVLAAHHDAAHSGEIFNPTLVHKFLLRFPAVLERARWWPRIMFLVFGGPALVSVGSLLDLRAVRRLGTALSLGSVVTMADIGRSEVVPGANDNLSGVAALVGIARLLAERPVSGLRVVLVSTGSEESFEEGMLAYALRHPADLDPARSTLIVLDTVGSEHLVLLEGEGMLLQFAYDAELKDLLHATARELGIEPVREHLLSFGSDALVGIHRGVPTTLVASFDEFKLPANYHWPTDVPDNVDFSTVEECVAMVEAAIRRLAAQAEAASPRA